MKVFEKILTFGKERQGKKQNVSNDEILLKLVEELYRSNGKHQTWFKKQKRLSESRVHKKIINTFEKEHDPSHYHRQLSITDQMKELDNQSQEDIRRFTRLNLNRLIVMAVKRLQPRKIQAKRQFKPFKVVEESEPLTKGECLIVRPETSQNECVHVRNGYHKEMPTLENVKLKWQQFLNSTRQREEAKSVQSYYIDEDQIVVDVRPGKPHFKQVTELVEKFLRSTKFRITKGIFCLQKQEYEVERACSAGDRLQVDGQNEVGTVGGFAESSKNDIYGVTACHVITDENKINEDKQLVVRGRRERSRVMGVCGVVTHAGCQSSSATAATNVVVTNNYRGDQNQHILQEASNEPDKGPAGPGVDIAIWKTAESHRSKLAFFKGIEKPNHPCVLSGNKVKKTKHETGATLGEIGRPILTDYHIGGFHCSDVLQIFSQTGRPFAAGGDSGSLVYVANKNPRKALAIIHAIQREYISRRCGRVTRVHRTLAVLLKNCVKSLKSCYNTMITVGERDNLSPPSSPDINLQVVCGNDDDDDTPG